MPARTRYEIVIRGRASASLLRPLLDDFSIDDSSSGLTRLVGDVIDSSHLHGVLTHLTSLNAQVISVGPCEESQADPPAPRQPPLGPGRAYRGAQHPTPNHRHQPGSHS